MPTRDLVIAIDGPAASGKSTTARIVADRLHYVYIDTGAMYRAVTLAVLRAGIDPTDVDEVGSLAASLDVSFRRADDGTRHVLLDGYDVSSEIRLPEVTASVSRISSYPAVRAHLVALQKRMGRDGGVVLDGRDIGTVVFPDADVKVFMVADIDSRARRRLGDLVRAGTPMDLEELREDIERRDSIDSSRAASPLRKADDAVEIDTSGLTIDQQVERVLALVRSLDDRVHE